MTDTTAQSPVTTDVMKVGEHLAKRNTRKRATGVTLGVALVALGLSRRGTLRTVLITGGVALALHAGAGKTFKDIIRLLPRPLAGRIQQYGGGRDLVDEASWESFPASDPPSFT